MFKCIKEDVQEKLVANKIKSESCIKEIRSAKRSDLRVKKEEFLPVFDVTQNMSTVKQKAFYFSRQFFRCKKFLIRDLHQYIRFSPVKILPKSDLVFLLVIFLSRNHFYFYFGFYSPFFLFMFFFLLFHLMLSFYIYKRQF